MIHLFDAKELKQMRLGAKLSKVDTCRICGIHWETLTKLESGESKGARNSTLEKLYTLYQRRGIELQNRKDKLKELFFKGREHERDRISKAAVRR